MKILVLIVIFAAISCNSTKTIVDKEENVKSKTTSDSVRIANDEYQYEVIVYDIGFSSWLASQAKPRGYYSEIYLENRNQIYVMEWNSRVMQPQKYGNLYEMRIDYDRQIHYGYEVNYLLYNYFIFFQITNKQQLDGFLPRP